MIRVGKVIESKNGICTVAFTVQTACKDCGQCKHAQEIPTIKLDGKYEVGDYVNIHLPDNQFLKATFIAYLLPLIGLMMGLWIGSKLIPNSTEFTAFLTAITGMGIPLFFIWLYEKTKKKKAAWEPYITNKVYNVEEIPEYIIETCKIYHKE